MTNWETCPAVERHPDKLSGAWVFTGTECKKCHSGRSKCHLYVANVPRMGQFVGQAGGARRLSLGGPGCCHGRAVSE